MADAFPSDVSDTQAQTGPPPLELQHIRQHLDLAGGILVALDADGRIREINRKGCEILGYPAAELLGRDWFDTCLPERVRAEVREVFVQAMSGSADIAEFFENPVRTRAGVERLVAWHNATLRDRDGRIVGVISSGEDITRRREAEHQLSKLIKDLADLKFALDQSAIVAVTDVAGKITYVNDKFCEISKYARDELLGQDHRIINSTYHPKEFFRTLWQTIARGQIWRGEIRNRAKDGTFYWVDTTIVPFLNPASKPYQYLAIRYEITERKRAEERLREQAALARLGEMAAVVAHEVKNPLAGIRGALQIISGRLPAASAERAVLGDIQTRIDSLNHMVQDLLQFARPRPPKLAPVEIAALVRSTALLLQQDPTVGGVEVDVSSAEHVVHVDAEQVQVLFYNLLLNAAQAMGGRGRIDVEVRTLDGWCDVAVRDRGPGIPPDVRQKMFEPFFTTKHRGTGLGLAIARRVVELHGGELTAQSPPDGGAILTVRLPLT